MISVVIPAHNEGSRITRLLTGLHRGVIDGRLEVVVVANGCTDDTAARARDFIGVKVVELPIGHKPSALNEGERHVSSFPRFFVDADTRFTVEDLVDLALALEEPGVLAVAPSLELDTSESSLMVRSYCRIWGRLPNVTDALSSRGCFGVSAEGRTRWAEFPDLVNDDRYVHSLFSASERRNPPSVISRVKMPETVKTAIARRARVQVGLNQLTPMVQSATDVSNASGWLRVVMSHPSVFFDVPAYVTMTLLARREANRSACRTTRDAWALSQVSRTRV